MERKKKVELFEQIRREYEFGNASIRSIAKKYRVHRRTVRQAIENAEPPERKKPIRSQPRIGAVKGLINEILEKDLKNPRKQRHTAHRIYERLKQGGWEVSEASVRRYVRRRKEEIGLLKRETFVPQCYGWGEEAQVDWYEAYAELDGEMQKVEVFSMRSMAGGAAFHRAYLRSTQQAFLEAHQLAFHYFGGVFHRLRYDNLPSAVKKILQGHRREETARFIAFRSHWQFESEFCRPGKEGAHEKGGVEGEVGYFRRNHLVPIPKAANLAELNQELLRACRQDYQRLIGERKQSVGAGMIIEREYLLPLATTDFELAEESFPLVDTKGRVKVRANFYSVPCPSGLRVRVRILPQLVECWREGRLIACHERCYGRGKEILNLEHYLDVLERKPGALAASKPLQQWREAGHWPASFDRIWQDLQRRLGKQGGTKAMVELLQLGRRHGWERLRQSIDKVLELRCSDLAAIRHLISADALAHHQAQVIDIGSLVKYERPLPQIENYDQLMEAAR